VYLFQYAFKGVKGSETLEGITYV